MPQKEDTNIIILIQKKMNNQIKVTIIWETRYEKKEDWVLRVKNCIINNFWTEFWTIPLIKGDTIVFSPSKDATIEEMDIMINSMFENHNSEFRVKIK